MIFTVQVKLLCVYVSRYVCMQLGGEVGLGKASAFCMFSLHLSLFFFLSLSLSLSLALSNYPWTPSLYPSPNLFIDTV